MTHTEISNLTSAGLRELLLTVDGKGKAAKEIALERLIEEAYSDGFNNGEANERGDDA